MSYLPAHVVALSPDWLFGLSAFLMIRRMITKLKNILSIVVVLSQNNGSEHRQSE